MKKCRLLVMACLLCLSQVQAQEKKIFNETDQQKEQRLSWWTHDRFGMFIHWGLYSLPARHEWVKNRERLTDSAYQPYFDRFNPDLYNPREWARMAREAGMKYAVITTKHHEGFCLFDSKFTTYKATNTAAGKDLIKEWVDAFRAEGLKVGFYYSLIDWHHPDFTIDEMHPQRPTDPKKYEQLNKGRDMAKYRTYLYNQVKELMTNYGKIDMLWTDFSYPGEHGKGHEDWGSIELLKMVRKLQPGIIVNNRLDLESYADGGDFVTPEQYKVASWPTKNGKRIPWETCQTFSGSWGYHRDETSWKDNKQLLVLLIESVSKGGNLLLNVGPTARGLFDTRAQDRLKGMGDWMLVNGRSVYGCTQAPDHIKRPENSLLTYNPATKRLYVHLLDYPLQRFELPDMKGKVKYAQFLHDGSEIRMSNTEGGAVALDLPVHKPGVEIPVIELILE
ncbi:alpha-L-fucosidase [Chitinophaga nivalis]|uniref:alpha-L-fucosidase n=1 Tax=Chitinophaga nivalis TaxID=2991709 RepID=A0ABT3IEE2_9BACT|nr:alpha-L-fucosidase [Chitinophaga nivalis]MCW3467976.1 alpha-L-fucosidase [Chitinophaga nivalis]MCW3482333.1 alpha-L-fucosidase [Chitinophaga nivalis]